MYRSILFLLVSILLLNGCKDDDSTSSIIGNNLFPLTSGNKLEYKMYDIDSSYVEISGTTRKLIREIGSSVYIGGRYASPVYETIYNSSDAVLSRDTMYVYKSASDDTISYYLKMVFPLTDNQTITMNKWVPVFLRAASTATTYAILDTTVTVKTTVNGTEYPVPLRLRLECYINDQSTISVPENSSGYKCNELELYYYLSNSGLIIRQGTYFDVWLVEGVGPVKERRLYLEKSIGRDIDLTAKTIK